MTKKKINSLARSFAAARIEPKHLDQALLIFGRLTDHRFPGRNIPLIEKKEAPYIDRTLLRVIKADVCNNLPPGSPYSLTYYAKSNHLLWHLEEKYTAPPKTGYAFTRVFPSVYISHGYVTEKIKSKPLF